MKSWMAIFNFPAPQLEHAKIESVISGASEGRFKRVAMGTALVYMYETNTPPHMIDFSKVLLNGDKAVFVELGTYAKFRELGALEGWWNARNPHRP